ncbi:DUF2243 domain-containing protein [Methylocystis rosea]|uniref:DUF2243 domain-containing protein n=1 Tax=Methylocystis rosea TaxID=173366 RepID=UPI00037F77F3|nr:DUF2243 domain-containing protein [Methylocystis rosea]
MTQSASIRPARARGAFPTAAAIILGVGLGIFFDGIVLHQLLQWHHLVSNWRPAGTVEGMEFNTYWDGMLHSFAYVCVGVGLFLLWRASRRAGYMWSGRRLAGALLIGWGGFNLYDGVINHLVLGIHHVNERVDRAQWPIYDAGFIIWGAAMLLAGFLLLRGGKAEAGSEVQSTLRQS